MSDRGVSSPIGVILLIGMTVAVVTAVVVVGGAAIDDTRANAERSQMENAMSQFSSKASLVSLGESGSQQFNLGRVSEGDVSVKDRAGNATLYINRTNGEREYITNVSMGSIVYQNGGTEIAYQGGGVWKRSNGHSTMVSPPEYHYKLETLTFPIINVTGSGGNSGQISGTIRSDTTSEQLYPDSERGFNNPVEDGTVYVEIESKYCSGWESFFRERTYGGIKGCNEGEDDTVVVDLTVPFDPAFETAVTSQRPISGKTGNIDSYREGIVAPSASGTIKNRIDDCVNDRCNSTFEDTLVNGTYYTEDASDFDGLELDTSSGSIDVIINDADGGVSVDNGIQVTGENNVSVYVATSQNFEMNSNIVVVGDEENKGGGNGGGGSSTGDPSQLIMYLHSNISYFNINGNDRYVGGLYAPNTVIGPHSGGGNMEITGAIVVEDVLLNSGAASYNHDPSMVNLDVDISRDTLKYLHVSENGIEVELT